jgi:hypothetical protein
MPSVLHTIVNFKALAQMVVLTALLMLAASIPAFSARVSRSTLSYYTNSTDSLDLTPCPAGTWTAPCGCGTCGLSCCGNACGHCTGIDCKCGNCGLSCCGNDCGTCINGCPSCIVGQYALADSTSCNTCNSSFGEGFIAGVWSGSYPNWSNNVSCAPGYVGSPWPANCSALTGVVSPVSNCTLRRLRL